MKLYGTNTVHGLNSFDAPHYFKVMHTTGQRNSDATTS